MLRAAEITACSSLSEFTGAAVELNEALLVNPTDTEQMANDIAHALSMPLDRTKEQDENDAEKVERIMMW